jgi:hypothetical protein
MTAQAAIPPRHGEHIGLGRQLVELPERANEPKIAAKPILSFFPVAGSHPQQELWILERQLTQPQDFLFPNSILPRA